MAHEIEFREQTDSYSFGIDRFPKTNPLGLLLYPRYFYDHETQTNFTLRGNKYDVSVHLEDSIVEDNERGEIDKKRETYFRIAHIDHVVFHSTGKATLFSISTAFYVDGEHLEVQYLNAQGHWEALRIRNNGTYGQYHQVNSDQLDNEFDTVLTKDQLSQSALEFLEAQSREPNAADEITIIRDAAVQYRNDAVRLLYQRAEFDPKLTNMIKFVEAKLDKIIEVQLNLPTNTVTANGQEAGVVAEPDLGAQR